MDKAVAVFVVAIIVIAGIGGMVITDKFSYDYEGCQREVLELKSRVAHQDSVILNLTNKN